MSIRIQKLGVSDMDTLLRWRMTVLAEVFSIPEDEDTSGLREENRRYYEKRIASGEHTAVLALDGDEGVGCGGICYYQEMPSPDNPTGECAYLMNIYVTPARRHQGIAQEIVKYLISDARARGVTKIYLETSDDGRRLYERLGFRPMEGYLKLE